MMTDITSSRNRDVYTLHIQEGNHDAQYKVSLDAQGYFNLYDEGMSYAPYPTLKDAWKVALAREGMSELVDAIEYR